MRRSACIARQNFPRVSRSFVTRSTFHSAPVACFYKQPALYLDQHRYCQSFSQPFNPQTGFQQNTNTPQNNQNSDFMVELGDDMVMSVSRFKGFVIVHLRQYYYKEQERKPGKGVTLTPADLDKLEDYFDDIDADLHRLSSEQGDFAKKFDWVLSNSRNVSVHMRQSVPYVHFEYNSQKGKKFIDITAEQYGTLKHILPQVKERAKALKDDILQSSTLYQVPLSDWTEAKVLKLGEKFFVDIRKTPSPESTIPRNGISIRYEEWETLISNLEPLYKAISQGDLSYSLNLNVNRKVSLNHYKDNWYVVIREYFFVDGKTEPIPGKKGINMRMEEWQKFTEEIANLTNHLRNARNAQ